MSLKTTEHFIDPDRIITVDETTPLYRVYQQLADRQKGGVILTEAGRPTNYVKAAQLAEIVVQQAHGEVKVLRALSDCAIREVVKKPESRVAVVPVDTISVDVNADPLPLQQQAERVFEVKENNVFVGWFLNHEGLVATTTRKTQFVCTNGHENPDPDHGTCYQCPAALKDVVSND